jgi:hypothetical protein
MTSARDSRKPGHGRSEKDACCGHERYHNGASTSLPNSRGRRFIAEPRECALPARHTAAALSRLIH